MQTPLWEEIAERWNEIRGTSVGQTRQSLTWLLVSTADGDFLFANGHDFGG